MKNIFYLCIFLFFVVFIAYFFACFSTTNTKIEKFETYPIPKDKIIPDGYYDLGNGNMAVVPHGYKASEDKKSIQAVTLVNTNSNSVNSPGISGNTILSGNTIVTSAIAGPDPKNVKYNNDLSQVADIQYHKTENELRADNDNQGVTFGNTWIRDNSGNLIEYPTSKIQGNIVYYTPGSYRFGPSNYVPSYEDTIYLSKSTGLNTVSTYKPITKTNTCDIQSIDPITIEKTCQEMDPNKCTSMNCCVLLGGSKCVAGNAFGPTNKANYGDVFVRNKDFYYYNSKCYGNCPP